MEVEESGKTMSNNPHPAADDVHHSRKGSTASGRRRSRNICLGLIAVMLLVALIILILALTVFKPKHPVTTVNSISLDSFNFSLDIAGFRVHLNATVDVDLSIKNPNKVGFKYTNSSAVLKYKDRVIGEVPIPGGKIKGDGSTPLNLTLIVMADRLLSDSSLYSDVFSGTLPLTTYTRISGKVRILKLFNIHVVSYSTCDLNINVGSRSLANQTCRYKTKL